MSYSKAILSAFVLSAFLAIPSQTVMAGYMEPHRGAKAQIKKMKRDGLIPTSMSCKNVSKKMLKPEVKFTTKPNVDRRSWYVIAHYDKLNWQPVSDGKSGKLTKKYATRVTSSKSGKTFNCSLWHGPKGTLGKAKNVSLSARSGGGTVSTTRRK